MQLFVKGETLHAVNVTEKETVEELKGILSPLECIPIEEQVLSYGGVVLENEGFVSELVLPGGTLELTGRLLGGTCGCLYQEIYQLTQTMYRIYCYHMTPKSSALSWTISYRSSHHLHKAWQYFFYIS